MNPFYISKKVSHFFACIILFMSCAAYAEVAVVVHPNNVNTMAADDITRIFLGKTKTFPDGTEAIPLDQAAGTPNRGAFVSTILKKVERQIKAYWSQLLFTGKGTPPREAGASADVKKLIAQNPSLIGYIDSADVDATVKVVLKF